MKEEFDGLQKERDGLKVTLANLKEVRFMAQLPSPAMDAQKVVLIGPTLLAKLGGRQRRCVCAGMCACACVCGGG